jgi:hypothetical protein
MILIYELHLFLDYEEFLKLTAEESDENMS